MSQLNSDILAIVRCGTQFRNEKTVDFGLRGCHIGYLSRICSDPGISQDRLAQRMLVNKSNVARQMAVLEEGGFITRTPSAADKRVLKLYPTDKTLELLPQLRQIVSQWDQVLTEGLTPEEIETVTHILSKMRDKATVWMEGR